MNDNSRKYAHIQERLQNIDYVDLYPDQSCVDGWFTANELRKIANAMDEIAALEKVNDRS